MSNLEEPFVNAYNVLPEAPLKQKGFAMKTRPIGQIVAYGGTCNLILHMDIQDPKEGYAMRLGENLDGLSEEQRSNWKSFFQERLDTLRAEGEQELQRMLEENELQAEQSELELESTEDDVEEDPLAIPDFLKRQST